MRIFRFSRDENCLDQVLLSYSPYMCHIIIIVYRDLLEIVCLNLAICMIVLSDVIFLTFTNKHKRALSCALLIHTDMPKSSWWLQITWHQIGTRPSTTTMLTWLWPDCHINHINLEYTHNNTVITQAICSREVDEPMLSFSSPDSTSHSYNALMHTPSSLPWIFPGAPSKINGAPGNIQGNLTALQMVYIEAYPRLRVVTTAMDTAYPGHGWRQDFWHEHGKPSHISRARSSRWLAARATETRSLNTRSFNT